MSGPGNLAICRPGTSQIHESHGLRHLLQRHRRDPLQALLWLERKYPYDIVLEASHEEFAPQTVLRHLSDIETSDFLLEKLCLAFTEHSCFAVKLEVDDLSALDVDHNLPAVATGTQNFSLVGLPLGPPFRLSAALDLN